MSFLWRLATISARWSRRGSSAATPWDKAEVLSRMLQRTRDLGIAQRLLETNRFRKAVRPTLMAHPGGHRHLVLAPHQDDEVIGCGGVLLHALAAGHEVQTVYLTDGTPPSLTGSHREQYREKRQLEAKRVWQAAGGNVPIFWDMPDRIGAMDAVTVERLLDLVRDFRPYCLFLPFFLEDPEDHRKASQLLWMAYRDKVAPQIQVWSYQVTTMICPNVAVDITDVEPRKYELMKMWESQNGSFDYAHRTRGLNAANSLYVQGLMPDNPRPYIELFFVLPLEEYIQLVSPYFQGLDLPDPKTPKEQPQGQLSEEKVGHHHQ